MSRGRMVISAVSLLVLVVLLGCAGTTPADPALVAAAREGDLATIQERLAAGVDVNGQDESSVAALHMAVVHGHKEAAELLIANGANVNARDDDGWTPLHRALWCGASEVAELLIENGADINAKNEEGMTPLHWAADSGEADVVKILIAKGARMPKTMTDGRRCTGPPTLATGTWLATWRCCNFSLLRAPRSA